MIEAIGILAFVILFAAFSLVVRENRREGGCGMCGVKKAFGLCNERCPAADRRRDAD